MEASKQCQPGRRSILPKVFRFGWRRSATSTKNVQKPLRMSLWGRMSKFVGRKKNKAATSAGTSCGGVVSSPPRQLPACEPSVPVMDNALSPVKSPSKAILGSTPLLEEAQTQSPRIDLDDATGA